MEDSEIVALYWQRSDRAIEETADKLGDYCFTVAHRILGDPEDARECVNDAYLAAWNAIPPHRPERLATFVGKITRRIALNRLAQRRTAKRQGGELPLALEELAECVGTGNGAEDQVEATELAAAVNRFLRALPKDRRHVFICRYWHLDPVGDIARQFGWSESKVKSMLRRTRGQLRKYLEKEELL
jgi:RNA polymerase sigma-70 factor (ECF subfamily)